MTLLTITINLDLIPRGKYGHVVAEALTEYAELIDQPYTLPGDIAHLPITHGSQTIGRAEIKS